MFLQSQQIKHPCLAFFASHKASCCVQLSGISPLLFPRQRLDHLKHPAWFHRELGVPGQDEQGQHHQDRPHSCVGELR